MDVPFRIDDPAFQQDPATTFTALREHCPFHHTDEPGPHFTVSRWADVSEVLRDHDIWSSKFGPGLSYADPDNAGVLVSSDPPKHTRERLAITKVFRPSSVEEMRPDIAVLVDEVVAGFAGKGEGDIVDLLAMPVPLTVMCWLLGTPTADIELFRNWVLPMAEGVTFASGRADERVANAYRDFTIYFSAHIDARRQLLATGDPGPDDLLTRLLTVERDGERLNDRDVLGFCQFLLVAGSATTTLLIGNVIHRLLQHPDQMALLQADRSLLEGAVEESLRIDAPVHGLFRTNEEPVERCSPPPTSTPRCGPSRSASTSPGTWRTCASTSPSVWASTTASAPPWPAWRPSWPSARSWIACPTSRCPGRRRSWRRTC